MERYSPLVALFSVSLLAGFLLMRDVTVPLAWGISIFVPAINYLVSERFGVPVSAVSTAVIVALLLPLDGRVSLNVGELLISGFLFRFVEDLRYLIVLLSLLLFAGSVLEDVAFGVPEEVLKSFPWISDYRWGFYFLSSAVVSSLLVGAVHVVSKRNFGFRELNFGFPPVALFIAGGVLSLLKLIPAVSIFGQNAVIASFGFFTVQGFAVLMGFLDRVGMATKLILLFVFVFIPVLIFIVAAVVGMFDFWFNFRKLKGGKR